LLKLLKVQFQVLHALTLREVQGAQASLVFGFGWVLFDAFLAFAGLLIMKMAIKGWTTMPGIPPITFLVSGLIPWLMFSSIYHLPDGAIKRGRNMLLLPIVTELDLVLAASFVTFVTYTILYTVLATISSFYEGVRFPKFFLGIVLLFLCMALMGVGFGLILMLLTRLYGPAGKFVSFFMRFGMVFSGVIFQITMFPSAFWPYLTWNPLLHVEELLRANWLYTYHSPVASPAYVMACLIGMVFFGLLLERYVRRRLPP
jgi:capsular polysaccharide transport system permease protein